MDAQPYAFYCSTKTLGYALTKANTIPMETIRLNATDGHKFYKKVSQIDASGKVYYNGSFSLTLTCICWRANF